MNRRDRRCRFSFEPLEMRLALSGSTPANVIGTSTATVSRPHEVSQTSVQVAPKNITPQKHGTIFGLFVQPTSGSQLQPQILAVRGSTGKALPVKHGRPFRSGVSDEAVAFTKDSTAGPVTIEVTGATSPLAPIRSRRPWSVMSTATARSTSRIFRHSLPRTCPGREIPTTIPPRTSTTTA